MINFLFLLLISFSIHAIDTQETLKKVVTLIPENPVIIEAGTRFGSDTVQKARKWLNRIIHALESFSSSYQELYNKVKNYENIFIHSLALSRYNGTADFYVALENAGASLLLPHRFYVAGYGRA